MKRLFILLLSFITIGCEKPPSFQEMKMNFEQNKRTFSELQSFVCEMGKVAQPFRYFDGSFVYSMSVPKRENVPTIQYLDERLSKIGVTSIGFKKGENVNCTLSIQQYVAGFAGSGVSYDYKYNVENPNTPSEQGFTLERLPEKGQVRFDEPLANGWYLSFYSN